MLIFEGHNVCTDNNFPISYLQHTNILIFVCVHMGSWTPGSAMSARPARMVCVLYEDCGRLFTEKRFECNKIWVRRS